MGRRHIPKVQVGRRRWQIKDLPASLAGPAGVVSCYRVSELATASLECEQDNSGDFLLTLVLERGSRLLVSGCTTPGQVGSTGVPGVHGEGVLCTSRVRPPPAPCPPPKVQAGFLVVGPGGCEVTQSPYSNPLQGSPGCG